MIRSRIALGDDAIIWVEGNPLLADTKARIESNRAMVAATRNRIARSWRKLNSDFAITGGSAPPLRETVRALLASGMLPPAGDESSPVTEPAGAV